ncbi:MAG: hypothetical protein KJ574_05000 [Nanoarchaeota archaeon]|nr:hypothetical protein [Nanoarchaeota archaeon]
MFAFDKDVKKGFRSVKKDMSATKDSLNEWIIFLNENQREMKMRIWQLERKIEQLESRFDEKDIEALRFV